MKREDVLQLETPNNKIKNEFVFIKTMDSEYYGIIAHYRDDIKVYQMHYLYRPENNQHFPFIQLEADKVISIAPADESYIHGKLREVNWRWDSHLKRIIYY